MAEPERPRATEEEVTFFKHATRGLPTDRDFSGTGLDNAGQAIPYGLSFHSVRPVRKALEIAKPFRILEIGFAQGHSASLFLESEVLYVTSIEKSQKAETLAAAEVLKARFPGRFRIVHSDSALSYDLVKDVRYDMIFIDGDHLEPGVIADIELGLKLEIPWFLFDDWLPYYGPGVQPAARKTGIMITETWFNMAIGKPPSKSVERRLRAQRS